MPRYMGGLSINRVRLFFYVSHNRLRVQMHINIGNRPHNIRFYGGTSRLDRQETLLTEFITI